MTQFTREDLNKPENRINTHLFGAQSIPEFWDQLLQLLGIPECPCLHRVTVEGTSNRPDFIFRGKGAEGCIEVELGGPNQQQLDKYRSIFSPVICIVGSRRHGEQHGHKSLEEVAELAKDVAVTIQQTNPPAAVVLDHLAETIKVALKGSRNHAFVQEIPSRLMDLPWFMTAVGPLLRLRDKGYVENRTVSVTSLSLQLKPVRWLNVGTLALLTQQDPTVFRVPIPTVMERVFGGELADVTTAWEDLLRTIMPNWRHHSDGNHRIPIETQVFEQSSEAFGRVFDRLARRVLPDDYG